MQILKFPKYYIFALSFLIALTVPSAVFSYDLNDSSADTPVTAINTSKKDGYITSTYEEPLNITLAKQKVKAYYYGGKYQKAINQVGGEAMKCLMSYKDAKGKKLAVVFGIDETAVSTYQWQEETDFSFNESSFRDFLLSGRETVIQPTLDLFNKAKEMGIATIFIENRRESLRDVIEKNLKRLGYDGWTMLILKPNDAPSIGTRLPFMRSQREKLEKDGYDIIINIGSQLNGLQGGYADNAFKYPNPFYYVP